MPITREFTIRMDNRPGSLGNVCRQLADARVNIVAFQSVPSGKTILVCLVVDKPDAAQTVLDRGEINHTDSEVVQVRLPHDPGELGSIAAKLGEANININYAYCGVEPGTNAPLVILGVTDASRAAAVLDGTAVAAARA
ncbi:MAG TPA: ACT domain-containing protein [Candidatus Methylomirabilis sp.]|nr:ACT domain-containing protein [Candidatus Methylomirabilis sp.]